MPINHDSRHQNLEVTNPMTVSLKSDSLKIIIGYVKEYVFRDFDMNSVLIPIEIYQLICTFYGNYDNFDRNNLGRYHILNHNLLQQNGGLATLGTLNTTLFRQEIENGRHCWTFRIVAIGRVSGIDIGIWKMHSGTPPTDKWFVKNQNGYCFRVRTRDKWHGNSCSSYGTYANHNDIVAMYFDADDLILKYSVRNLDCGIAFTVEKTVYKAAVCTYGPGAAIEFITYSEY